MKEMYIVRLDYNEERAKYNGVVNNEILFCEYISTFYFEPNKCHEVKNTDENLAKFFRECLVWDYEEEGIIPAVMIWDNFEGSVVEYFVFCENKRIAYWREG